MFLCQILVAFGDIALKNAVIIFEVSCERVKVTSPYLIFKLKVGNKKT